MKRQNVRHLLLLISLLLFPVTIWYFSPAVIINGMAQHILNGSFFVFLGMLVFSMFFGRVFCGYLCPAGGLQECAAAVNPKPAKQKKRDIIKYVIWTLWMAAVIITFILGQNDVTIDFFFMTDHGISVAQIYDYIIYYGVVLIIAAPALIHGKRASCHYICWMAPFMVIGGKLGRLLHLPQLHIKAKKESCISCGKCSKVCPMGLDTAKLASLGKIGISTECILCGACADSCPKKVLSYSFGKDDKK